jgi:hypothetical protein
MNINESKILLSLYEQGGFKPRFGKNNERVFKGEHGMHECVNRITLGPAFIENALKDPDPAYDLKVLKPSDSRKKYFKLSNNMKLHLHVKRYVADHFGLDFGGNVKCFKWELI